MHALALVPALRVGLFQQISLPCIIIFKAISKYRDMHVTYNLIVEHAGVEQQNCMLLWQLFVFLQPV